MIIGLSGYAQSGKDTAAAQLAPKFTRLAFADKLKELAYEINPEFDGGCYTLQYVVDAYGWEEAKKDRNVREYLQTVGVVHRKVLGPDVWVDAAFQGVDTLCDDYVFTDVRFPNEFDAIRACEGFVFRIMRPDVGPVNGHESERALDGYRFDATFHNDGTPEQLGDDIKAWLSDNA